MHITIIGRRWFQKTYGNTYHSCTVYVNNGCIGVVPFVYGYGTHYQQTAVELLNNHGIPATWPLWRWCEDNGHTLTDSVTDVTRKKDLV